MCRLASHVPFAIDDFAAEETKVLEAFACSFVSANHVHGNAFHIFFDLNTVLGASAFFGLSFIDDVLHSPRDIIKTPATSTPFKLQGHQKRSQEWLWLLLP